MYGGTRRISQPKGFFSECTRARAGFSKYKYENLVKLLFLEYHSIHGSHSVQAKCVEEKQLLLYLYVNPEISKLHRSALRVYLDHALLIPHDFSAFFILQFYACKVRCSSADRSLPVFVRIG